MAAAQPPGMSLPANGVETPESLGRGDGSRPGLLSRLGGYAAPGYEDSRLTSWKPPSPWLGVMVVVRVCGDGLAAGQPPGMKIAG